MATHTFHALGFVENISLKELAAAYPEARRTSHEIWYSTPLGGRVFVYPFGAMAFENVAENERASHVDRLRRAARNLHDANAVDDLVVHETPGATPDVREGELYVDHLSFEGSSVVALTVAQSAAMEYYERIVDQMFLRTDHLVERLEASGRAPLRTRPLHRFIGTAIGVRNEVLSILHLLDKPDAVWEDLTAEGIYRELRAEFDLSDRYLALEHKLTSVREALELVLDVSRDYRLVMLEGAVVLLIVVEIVLSIVRH
jgi:uncharacterized Rmd1/YagE family protein